MYRWDEYGFYVYNFTKQDVRNYGISQVNIKSPTTSNPTRGIALESSYRTFTYVSKNFFEIKL